MLVKLPLGSEFYTADGKLRDDLKYSINFDELKIRDSKIIGKPEDKFETMLFLPVGEGRKGEGGLRTRGYFKFSYKYIDKDWFICDIEGNPLKPAPVDIQEKINSYIASLPEDVRHKMTELPLITVITVVLNGEKYLEQTIQSVINQTYPNVEYIIIDGGSTDGTLDIIKKYEDEIDYWVSERDKGISDAFNKGITTALGEIIGIINADDWYELNAVNIVVAQFLDKRVDVVHGMLRYWYKADKTELFFGNDALLFKEMTINHPTTFVSSKCYKRFGLFREDFRCAMDYEWLLRVKINGATFLYINQVIANMRSSGKSDSQWRQALYEVAKAKSLHLPNTKMHFFYFFYQIIKRSIRILLEWLRLHFIIRFYHANFSLVKKRFLN
ncbi:glycosyltransferase family 2 protein [Candidatus Kryptobacter tengchongensis]|uniref:glycosyltransferase family 2 protein n=1 Tax=Kryptobacter tengchongensis TaxID=1643429 RepID=UPI00070746AE|nr:glycosyltransferase family 2 protein [Candidatus Kryptobacter tengchongensis]CUS77996.1 Glycosyltransferase involved in cell wall bisynthesis [Candidatus Kryptobacter tengchongensis]